MNEKVVSDPLESIALQQLRWLRGAWLTTCVLILGLIGAGSLWLVPPKELQESTTPDFQMALWAILALLGGVIVWLRSHLLNPNRIRLLEQAELTKLGVPSQIPVEMGRRATFLTRYSAACVLTWGLLCMLPLYAMLLPLFGGPWYACALVGVLALGATLSVPPKESSVRQAWDHIAKG